MEITLNTVFGNPALPVNRDYDSFTRANADTPGSTEGAGAPWQVFGESEWRAGIRDNKLSVWRSTAATDVSRGYCVVNTGKSDGIFTMRLDAITGGAQGANGNFVFRFRDPDNFLWVYANDTAKVWSLYRMTGGSPNLITQGTVTATYATISVRLQGSLITVYADGVKSAEASYSGLVNETRHGVHVRALTGETMTSSRFDNFSFTDL